MIVGGGISGLAAAFLLHERGFRHITLHEARSSAGGRIVSREIEGETLEEGAVFGSNSARLIHRMASAAGFPGIQPFAAPGVVIGGGASRQDIYRFHRTLPGLDAYRRLAMCLFSQRLSGTQAAGLHRLPAGLGALTTRQWAREEGFETVLEPFAVFLAGMGYGSVDEIPALYHVKLIAGALRNRLVKRLTGGLAAGHFHCPGGFRTLMEAIARYLVARGVDLRTDSEVTGITRGPSAVDITVRGRRESHDLLIMALPVPAVRAVLDLDEAERALLGKVQHLDYHTVIARAPGLRRGEWAGLAGNSAAPRTGRPAMFHGLAPDSDKVVVYQYGRSGADLDAVLAEDLVRLGASRVEVVSRHRWEYFPHVPLSRHEPRFHHDLEDLQGRRATYHVGSLFNGETTQHCVEYAEHVVARMAASRAE